MRLLIWFTTLLACVTPVSAQRKADLSKLVVVGDSLSAGFQNGSLLSTQQVHGYASLVAEQAGTALSLPLIGAPGIPNVLVLVNPGPPPVIQQATGTSVGRLDYLTQPTDLAVPGHTVQDALTTRPSFPVDSLTDLVLGFPGLLGGVSKSQVEWAEALAPTVVLVWLGSNDALAAAVAADASLVTPLASFQLSFSEVMDRLAATGARLVVANVPDVTVIPYLTSAEKVAATIGQPLSVIGPILGIAAGDYVTPDALALISATLQNPSLGPLPGNVVLTAGEVTQIREAIAGYNEFIESEAQAKGAALVDIHALVNSWQTRGVVVGGRRLTTDFLGGIISLDGVHPTNTGYAMFANAFIHAMNTRFAAGIPPIAIEHVAAADPLVLPRVGHPASSLGHIRSETAECLRELTGHHHHR
jgi:lysophospholipase L1-like esterase